MSNFFPFPGHRATGRLLPELGPLGSHQLFPTQKFLCPGAQNEPDLTPLPSVSLSQPLSGSLVEPVVVNIIRPKEKALWLTGASALSCPVAGVSPPQETRNPGQRQSL